MDTIETREEVTIRVFKISVKKALQLYDQCESVSKIIQQLAYPTRKRLYDWIAEHNSLPSRKAPSKNITILLNILHIHHLNLKLEAIKRCFEMGENVQLVSEEIGYSRASICIYTWQKVHS